MLGHKLVRQLCTTQETLAMPRMASGLLSATPVSIQSGGLPPLPTELMQKLLESCLEEKETPAYSLQGRPLKEEGELGFKIESA